MSKQEAPIIHQPIRESFGRLDKSAKLDQLRRFNISLTTYGLTEPELRDVFEQIRDLGFTPVRFYEVLRAVAWLMRREHIPMPAGRKNKQARGKTVEEILGRMRFKKGDGNELRIHVRLQDGTDQDIIADSVRYEDQLTTDIQQLEGDSMVLGKVLQWIKDFAKQETQLAIEENNPTQIPVNGPRILFQGINVVNNVNMKKKADHAITTMKHGAIRFGVLREVVRQGQIERRRRELATALAKGEIIMVPKFRLVNWPKDALMSHAREQVAAAVDEYIQKNNILCDPQDLKYQTLFRLTTYEVSDVFVNGSQLNNYLRDHSAYVDWRNILNLDAQFIQQFRINPKILAATIEEQYLIIKQRLQNSSLPVERILTRTGMFAEPGWVIQKRGNAIFAVQEEGVTATAGLVPLAFREINPEFAKQFHQDLHYIHTPRADIAFGLYIVGEDLPFSVLALEKIDRPYKQNVLLIQGYNPCYCYDLTRLYSRPGAPGNTSSSMFSLTFNHIKNNYPEIQAVVSAFMPSYATGISMISGGFDNPVLIKPLVHVFEERMIDGRNTWEHVTKRRQQESRGRRIRNKFPLLPTIELMSSLQSPRYAPFPEAKDFMIEII
ncbi:MAG: hypothetical protein KatS3mg083_583 [Candidatus Dojkabacteria bacterium]|nr:MAG: hypothetical protein KatS3mg083_583 [Candidatus Dojkabacteria bacterium]GIW61218.1 MAG: hypothetical protein KatS3mg089_0070 [Patescibacteria group bacterium]